MKDPVVNPAGDSIDQSSVTATQGDDSVIYYPNRALRAIIIQKTINTTSDGTSTDTANDASPPSIARSLRRINTSVKSRWSEWVSKSAFSSTRNRPLPDSFYCPIACELIVDPIIGPDGYTYEAEAIEEWIRINGKSPVTREPVAAQMLRPNNALYELIQREKKRTLESIHPSIRRWKESTASTSRRERPPGGETASPSTTPSSAHYSQYPRTPEELRRRRANEVCQKSILVFSMVVAILYFPVVVAVFAVFILIMICNGVHNHHHPENIINPHDSS